jgi:hypothetical protein
VASRNLRGLKICGSKGSLERVSYVSPVIYKLKSKRRFLPDFDEVF